MSRVAVITGITGQDGSYLAELLLEKSYIVYGIVRRSSSPNHSRISNILTHPNLRIREGDLCDSSSIHSILSEVVPYSRIEVYNLAAQSHVHTSFRQPEYTADVDAIGTLRLLECIRQLGILEKTRFYQASTSELFGKVQEIPQTETTPFHPRSPYGVAKLYSFWIVKNYREAYGLYACNGILFNHESVRRGEEFITRKITKAVGSNKVLEIGNLDAKRDWGYAPDFVKGMWAMLQQLHAKDYVLATGETHSVREFIEEAYSVVGIDVEWKGTGVDEQGYNRLTNKVLVKINPEFYRPCEVDLLVGDASLAHAELGWHPTTSFREIVQSMVNHDRTN